MISTSQATTRAIVRLARTAQEILAGSRLRYRTYSRTAGVAHFKSLDPATELDVDADDFCAHHLVLMLDSVQGERVVGTMRVVVDAPPFPQTALLLEAFGAYPHLLARLRAERTAPLPLMGYLEQAGAVREHYERNRERRLYMAEPTRLTASGEARRFAARLGTSAGGMFIEAALAYGFGHVGLDRVYIDCDVRNQPLYQRHGFREIGPPVHQPALGIEMLALSATPADIPAELRDRVRNMTRQFERSAEVMFDWNLLSKPCAHAA